MPIHYLILGTALLLLASVLASKASERLGVPALLMFLLVGMLAGSEGPGGIHFDDPHLVRLLGTFALAYILFAGGLDTEWKSVRPVFRSGVILATAGVLLTAVLVGLFAVWVLKFTWLEGLLLGSVISSTDAAAIFAVLRSRHVSLKGQLKPLLELESASNDPMAIFLTVTMLSLLGDPATPWWSALPAFLKQMLIGGVIGMLMGKTIIGLLNRVRLEYEGLYPVLTMATVLLTFGIAETVGGNGFLAVYLAGVVLGNADFIHKRSLARFHDGLSWLMQIAMFMTLGLQVFPSHLVPVIGSGLLLSTFLMLIARPLAVTACLVRSGLTLREKLLISWAGLRGAVPIVLATFPLTAGVPKAEMIFNLVFFVVIASVLLQGRSLTRVARWLRLDRPIRPKRRMPLEFERTEGTLRTSMMELVVPPDSDAVGRPIIHLGLPQGSLIAMIQRNGEYLVPNGGTEFQPGDVVLVLGEKGVLEATRQLLTTRRQSA
ncbi:MAG: potassium/proton antiporter [Phycisphaerae bacterium]|nr:potassium/proton antiporter [Phycisphaerae bacterium]